eukprot:scaffold638_cov382-Prasinococcus_capsulatus_cf.AAC.11
MSGGVLANLRELMRLDVWRELRQMLRISQPRRLQEEVDMHRLYLYTSAYRHFSSTADNPTRDNVGLYCCLSHGSGDLRM